MHFHLRHALRAIILLLFVLLILHLHLSGDLFKLINPKYERLSALGGIIFIILFVVQIQQIWTTNKADDHQCHEHCHQHDHDSSVWKRTIAYLIIMLPLFTGFVLPFATLDASIASNRGVMLSLTNHARASSLNRDAEVELEFPPDPMQNQEREHLYDTPADPNLYSNTISKEEHQLIIENLKTVDSIMMNDQVYATYFDEINHDIEMFIYREITLKGFVYKDEELEENQVVIGRFLITHCIADASFIGFLSEVENASLLAEDMWVELTGTLQLIEYKGIQLPTIKGAEWNEIVQPDQPYVYPHTIQIR